MFSNEAFRGSNRWPVVRLGAGNTTEVILLSHRFFPITTHWTSTTVPCCVEDCDLCELLPARGLFYLAVTCMSRSSILELGAQSAGWLEQHCKLYHQGIRPGLKIRLSRTGAKSPVKSEVIEEIHTTGSIDELTLANKVMALYKLPCSNPGEDIEAYGDRLRRLVRVRNERFALNYKASVEKRVRGR